MSDNRERIDQLVDKLETLLKKQESFSRDIHELRHEINLLKSSEATEEEIEKEKTQKEHEYEAEKEIVAPAFQSSQQQYKKGPLAAATLVNQAPKFQSDIEKFIGENLINKIGIAITVFGVAIGAKYAIDNQLISPLTRIMLGYMVGVGLLVFAISLKKKYENFSAVLLSGAMAIIYFLTYAAYDFYDLIPQIPTFLLMFFFTAFTVFAAINYNKQVIAQIGLVGAYAVPFLLSDGSGRVQVLFSYMTIINIGILILSFKKYWKTLYYSSFAITWLIYFTWYSVQYNTAEYFGLAFIFLSIFFLIFYITFLSYKLIKKEKFDIEDILLLLINSFIFYGLGYTFLYDHKAGEQLLGLFTIGNAIIHFVVSLVIYRNKLADKNLFYLVAGLVLVFITISIPVQLDGNWVTLLWVGEAALLFWIGREKKVSVYEKLSYYLIILAFTSLVQEWLWVYNQYSQTPENSITPLLNIHFITSLIFIAAFGFMNYLNQKMAAPTFVNNGLYKVFNYLIPVIFLFTLYYAFRLEIANYWDQLHISSAVAINNEGYQNHYKNYDLTSFRTVWILNYSLIFLSLLSFINIYKLKNRELGILNLALNVLAISIFLIQGLLVLSELRESYLNQTLAEYFHSGSFSLWIRYISYGCVAILLFASYKYIRQPFIKDDYRITYDMVLHASILWIASSELINRMDIIEFSQSYKLGLSILWGLYCLLLIALGIWKKKKHLRIGAIALFTVTLIKLFFYDIVHLDTIAKTVVFVSLGILLLIISFLYNKYRLIISDEVES